MKRLLALAAMLVTSSTFAHAYNKTVVCEYMAMVYSQHGDAIEASYVNAKLPSGDGEWEGGFSPAQYVEVQKVGEQYVVNYATRGGDATLYISEREYTVVENYHGVRLEETRSCFAQLNDLF